MGGLGTAIAGVAMAVALAGCQDDSNPDPLPPSATAQSSADGGGQSQDGDGSTPSDDYTGSVPEFGGDLPVDVVTGLQVMGNGCRQTSPRDACTVDGSKTYTWVGTRHRASLTGARMRLDADHGAWVVTLRFARADRKGVQGVATRAGRMGGYALILDSHTGNALEATAPLQVRHGRIRLRDLEKPDAWDLVSTFVTAATQR